MDGQASDALHHLELMLIDEAAEPMALPLSLLESITNGFSADQEIGRGGFAVVYKGMLQNGTVAVKRLFNIHLNENEFHREIQCLMKVKHKNIVRFLGYCADTQGNMAKHNGKLVMADVQQRLLCFEYLPKGNVHDYITDASSRLRWRTCYKIIKGICDGLHHLHDNHIVHLDLKPSNVLLDEHMVPKIADFGLSRCFEENQSQTITSKLVGSLGYFAPELYSGKITMKSDIYSVGVLIIEMLTGEKGCPDVGNVLASWSGRLEKSYEDAELEQVRVCTEIGIDCSDFNPAKRPVSTQNIVKRLKETEIMDEESSAAPNAVARKLFVHPRVLYFPSVAPYTMSWSSLYLTNYTDEHVAFMLSEKQTNRSVKDLPLYGLVPPRSTHALFLIMNEREEQFSTLVLESTTFGGVSNPTFQSPLDGNEWHDFFKGAKTNGNMVQRVILEAVVTGQREIASELKSLQTKMISVVGELLDVQPLELRFPFQLSKSNLCSLDLTNNTDEHVAFRLQEKSRESSSLHSRVIGNRWKWSFFANLPMCGIMPPRSTCTLVVITEEHKELPEETNFDLILHSSISGDKYIAQFQYIYECDEFFEELRETGNAVHEVALRAVSCPQGVIKHEPVVLHGPRMYGRTMSTRWKFLDAHPTETSILTGDSDGYVGIRNFVTQEKKDYFHVRERSSIHSDLSVDKIATPDAINFMHSFLSVDKMTTSNAAITSLKLIVRKQWFLVGTSDGFIHVCSYGTKIQKITSFRASKCSVMSMAIHPTQPYVLSLAEDSPIKLWNWDQGWECTQTYEDEHSRTIRQVTFNPKDTSSFASASSDHTVKIWSLHSTKSNYTLFGHLGEVNCLDFFTRGDQQYLISGSDDSSLRICDLHKRACVHKIENLMSPVISVVSVPDRPYLIIGLQDGTVHLWSSAHLGFERIFHFGYKGTVHSICLLGSGRVVIGREENILIIDTDNVKPAAIKGNNEPEEDMDNFSEERGNLVDAMNSDVSEAHLHVFKDVGIGLVSKSPLQAMKEPSEAELMALTCLSLGRLQI